MYLAAMSNEEPALDLIKHRLINAQGRVPWSGGVPSVMLGVFSLRVGAGL